MRKAMMVGAMALAGLGVREGQSAQTTNCQVIVYLQDQHVADPFLLARAKALTTSMFAGIGVRIRWEVGAPRREPRPDAEVLVRFMVRTPGNLHPGAPAYSLPYAPQSDVRVTIFYDRVLGPVLGDLNVAIAFLGHVLTHEITHVLQGVTRHSNEGVMKGKWTPKDRSEMRKGPLPFTAHDVNLIYDAIAGGKGAGERP